MQTPSLLNILERKQNSSVPPLSNQNGFTIIELLVVAVIIAILAMITFTLLPDNVREARRAEGEAGILSLSAAMQRYYLDNNDYIVATGDIDSAHTLVANYHGNINSNYFTYSVDSPTAADFFILATSRGFSDSGNNGKIIKIKYTRGGSPAEDWGIEGNTY